MPIKTLDRLKLVTEPHHLVENLAGFSPRTLSLFINHPTIRRVVLLPLLKYTKRRFAADKRYSYAVQRDRYDMFAALANSINVFLDRNKDKEVYRQAITTSLIPKITEKMMKGREIGARFKRKYGIEPPGFLTISPGKLCNLHCTGCYANSSSLSAEKLSFKTVSRIVSEKTRDWGSWFTVISGGEPFAWRSEGKDIIDLAEKHPDNFFLIFTNSTLISADVAARLAKVGNITPAISVEGFEEQTDKRRGTGTFKRILQAMKRLRENGVPFGISLTATRLNAEVVTSDELMDFFFEEQGASYAWMFQLMPIGRASTKMMVTPRQRLEMFSRVKHLVRDKKYFVADFWNCGAIVDGCISAGKTGGSGYLYIEWNGNVTPCVFNPYTVANINEIYKKGGSLNDVLVSPFFKDIRAWQAGYGLKRGGDKYGNFILPCPIKDHFAQMKAMIKKNRAKGIDSISQEAIKDPLYEKAMRELDREQEALINPVWEEEYCSGCRQAKSAAKARA